MRNKLIILPIVAIIFSMSACGGTGKTLPNFIDSGTNNNNHNTDTNQGGGGGSNTDNNNNSLSLLNADSKLFYSYSSYVNMPTLRYNNEDVPYVSMTSVSGIYSLMAEGTNKNITVNKDNNGNYTMKRRNYNLYSLNAKNQTLTLHPDFVRGILTDTYSNNGVLNDPIYNDELANGVMKASSSSRYIVAPQAKIIPLGNYGITLVETSGELFAPMAIHNLMLELNYGGVFDNVDSILFNGKDFFLKRSATPFRASLGNSSNYNFVFPYAYGQGVLLNIPMSKVSASSGEQYRFQGYVDGDDYNFSSDVYFTFSLLSGGSASLSIQNQYGQNVNIDNNGARYYNWQLDDSGTRIIIHQTHSNFSYDFGLNTDQTYYQKTTRSASIATFDYNLLKLYFEMFYGNKYSSNVNFETKVTTAGLKQGLMSTNVQTYENALERFLMGEVDDCHTFLNCSTFYTGQDSMEIRSIQENYTGSRRNSLLQKGETYQQMRRAALGDGDNDYTPFQVVGNTAFITFDSFVVGMKLHPISYYSSVNPNDPNNDTGYLIGSSMYQILQNSSIQNVVFDLTCNGGGDSRILPFILAMMTDRPAIGVYSALDDSMAEYTYSFDLNGDGIYGGVRDSFIGQYEFYILISDYSFSCGNALPTFVKNIGCAQILGQTSAGGSQLIGTYSTPDGFCYQTSSPQGFVFYDPNSGYFHSNDDGVPPDGTIPSSMWYNRSQLAYLINNL